MHLDDSTIANILLNENYVDREQVERAQKEATETGASFVGVLFSKNIISKDLLGQAIGEYFHVPYVNLREVRIEETLLSLVPEVVARAQYVIAYGRDAGGIKVATSNPQGLEVLHMVEKAVAEPIVVHYALESDIAAALQLYKPGIKDVFETLVGRLEDAALPREERDDISVQIVDMLLQYGYENKASDIHIEPYEKKILMRFRIDGVMHDILDMPKEYAGFISTRIKILARIATDEHRAALDGKLRHEAGPETVDVRVSIVPVTHGENIVMRLLSSKNRQFRLPDLGLATDDVEKVNRSIADPHGMILVTGPTGSGKTTTLYAVMKILNTRDVHISTIEDPVEYDLEGVSQIQVNTKTNLTFAKGLRAIVRQDPDIIMVGEIRDEETAGIAVNSALTGHLVLSTLHTNDAATTLPRLSDMGIEPFLVSSTVNIVIAQRLIRKICKSCRVSASFEEKDMKLLENESQVVALLTENGSKELSDVRVYKGAGCTVCGESGYAGRIGVFEVLEMNEDLKPLVMARASRDEINEKARSLGMTSMLQDGVTKVLNGETTLDEVLRVTKR